MQQLHYKIFGNAKTTLVILHGLFGSLQNWASQAKALSANFRVLAVDLRNHGQSPHFPTMGYPAMALDVIKLLDSLSIQQVQVIGHSMGGKTAMQLAVDFPERIRRLLVVDIAPRQYPNHHDEIFTALASLDLATLQSRKAADQALLNAVPDLAVRAFLLKNLHREAQGFPCPGFRWKMNLPVLQREYAHIAAAIEGSAPFQNPTLFIKGGNSSYIQPSDEAMIARYFPQARVKIMQNAGHWPHVENAALFTKLAEDFLIQ